MKFKLNGKKSVFALGLILAASQALSGSAVLAQTTPPNSAAGLNASYNWAGYVVQNGGYTSISGTWTVPQVPAGSGLTGDATWVGIGGVTDTALIQAGTQTLTNVNGQAVSYQAWYEMLPGNSQPIPITVAPGDSITASISEQAQNQWTIAFRDNANGQNFQTTVNYSSPGSSAEWIEEMPSQSNGEFIPLDNFGAVNFTAAGVVQNGQNLNIAQAGGQQMTMLNSYQQVLASPSALGYDGSSFSVSRASAAAAAPSTTPYGRTGWTRRGTGIQRLNGFFQRGQRLLINRFKIRFYMRESFRK